MTSILFGLPWFPLAQGGGPMDFDGENIVKIIGGILVAVFWVGRAVLSAVRKKPAEPAGPPAKKLKDFLEEIRQEAEVGGARDAAPQAAEPAAFAPDTSQRTEYDERLDRKREALRARRAQRQAEREARLAAQQAPVETPKERSGSLAERQLESQLSDRHLESSLEDRHVGSHLDERSVQSRLAAEQSAARKNAARQAAARSRGLMGALSGVSVKELLLAQVILGEPKAKSRRER